MKTKFLSGIFFIFWVITLQAEKNEKPEKLPQPEVFAGSSANASHVINSGGELWSWGFNQGSFVFEKSPSTPYRLDTPGTFWKAAVSGAFHTLVHSKTNGFGWGRNNY